MLSFYLRLVLFLLHLDIIPSCLFILLETNVRVTQDIYTFVLTKLSHFTCILLLFGFLDHMCIEFTIFLFFHKSLKTFLALVIDNWPEYFLTEARSVDLRFIDSYL